ncbi:MAG: ABC transporter ATP-binding protein [Acidimicrobiia bacterium]
MRERSDRAAPAARVPARAQVELSGATVRFGAVTALDQVDLVVAPGEVLAVLGASGSGKSTLLRVVAGLQPLDAGRVLLGGVDQAGVAPHRRGVGLMFQDHALFPHRDVAGNVAFGLRMRGQRGRAVDRRVDDLLELVGLPGFGRRAVSTLSGGEQQRVALARALAPEPRVLLLDEPFGALDRALRDRLVGELAGLFRELGQTVVAVTHDQAEAFALGDRLAVVDAGRVVRVGPPDEVWSDPRSVAAARLLGLANIAEVAVHAGVARTPWGDAAVGLGDGRHVVLVRPSAVRVAPEGPGVAGRVRRCVFRGDRREVRVEPPGGPPVDAWVDVGTPVERGDEVRIRLDGAGVVALEPDPAA